MKAVGTFELMRFWATLTGLALAMCYFGELYFGMRPSEILPMLICGIGGFELVLYAQDIWTSRKRHS